jgi:hypothetical protein
MLKRSRFLGRLAAFALAGLLLPACGTSNSGAPGDTGVAPNPTPTDPGIETFPSEGRTHMPVGTVIVYLTDPPTSGNHYPYPQAGGYYEFPIAAGFLVHSMEHGGVIIYYNPATVTDAQKNSLKMLAQAHPGIFSQVVCVPRDDPTYPIILTAWTHRLRLRTYDQSGIDGFVTLFLGQGPEKAPETPWGDPLVSNATATSYLTSAYYLRISDTTRPGSASTNTGKTYIAQNITFSVDLEVSAASALADTESIEIADSASSAVLAAAVYDASTGMLTLSIGATSFSPVAASTGAFHTVTFNVDSSHNATWSVEGTTTSPAMAFGAPTVSLGLSAAFPGGVGSAPDFFFGNVLVTSP